MLGGSVTVSFRRFLTHSTVLWTQFDEPFDDLHSYEPTHSTYVIFFFYINEDDENNFRMMPMELDLLFKEHSSTPL